MRQELVTPRPVKTKRDMYARWIKGEFGNRIRGWTSLKSLLADEYVGLVNIRDTTPASPKIRYGVHKSHVEETIKAMGGSVDNYRFNEPAPDGCLLLQGELMENQFGWCLMYSYAQTKMREALQNASHAYGLEAKSIIKTHCCPNSVEDIRLLLDLYPGHVVEFGAYRHNLGDMPHRNTIIWEVRNY